MSNQDTTDWYPPHINPVRVGYYQRNYGAPKMNSLPDYWDGMHWLVCDAQGRAYRSRTGFATAAPLPWRGLRGPQE